VNNDIGVYVAFIGCGMESQLLPQPGDVIRVPPVVVDIYYPLRRNGLDMCCEAPCDVKDDRPLVRSLLKQPTVLVVCVPYSLV
jgi:hypothetical protein